MPLPVNNLGRTGLEFHGCCRNQAFTLRTGIASEIATSPRMHVNCYHVRMFNFGKPKTAGDWIVHLAGAAVAIFLVWWMLRLYVV